MDRASPPVAFAAAVLAIGFLSAMDAAMKTVSLDYGALSALAWRALIATPVVGLAYFALRNGWPGRRAMRFHIIRGVIMVPMSFLFFYGLTFVPMAQAIALAFIAPLISLILAALLLKEKAGRRVWVGSLIAFAGILLIFLGQAQADLGREALLGSLAILGSAILYGYNIVLMRQQSKEADPIEVTFFYYAIAGAGFWLLSLFVGLPEYPAETIPELLAATLLSALGLGGLAWAYGRAEASYLSTSEYSGFLWAAIFGFFLFGEIPSLWTFAGAVGIVIGCLLAARPDPPPHPQTELVA